MATTKTVVVAPGSRIAPVAASTAAQGTYALRIVAPDGEVTFVTQTGMASLLEALGPKGQRAERLAEGFTFEMAQGTRGRKPTILDPDDL